MKHASYNLWVGIGAMVCSSAFYAAFAGQVIVWGDNYYHQTSPPAGLTNVVAVAGGDYHCLALQADGSVTAWGANYYHQTNVPPGLTNVVSIAAGNDHSLALRADGTAVCWGVSYFNGTNANPLPPDATNLVSLALGTGAMHVLALRADGTVFESGDSSGYYSASLTNPPPTAQHIVAVAAGSYHSLALRADGRVVAWGYNMFGETNVPSSATNIVAIAAGWYGDAAVRADGTVLVWGRIYQPLSNFKNILDVACPALSGYNSAVLALKSDGTLLYNWTPAPPSYPANQLAAIGAASFNGLLVSGTGAPLFTGLPVNRTVACGSSAYFRLLASGARPLAYQWTCNGTNLPGATNAVLALTNVQPELNGTAYALVASNSLGMATSAPMQLRTLPCDAWLQSSTPSAVVGQNVTLTASTIGQGPFAYQWLFYGTNLLSATNATLTLTNAQLTDSGAYSVVISNAFGLVTNSLWQPVVPTIVTNAPQSQLSFPGATVTFSVGLRAVIPITYQWQFQGVTLEGVTSNALTLTNVQPGQAGTYRVVYTDAYESVTNDVTLTLVSVAAWGQMGQQRLSPAFTNLLAFDFYNTYWLGLKADGTVLGWGPGWGNGRAATSAGLSNVIAISAGSDFSLALRRDGTVAAWGSYSDGQTNVPPDLTNVVAVAAGYHHALALKADGSLTAWGNNSYGQTNVPAGLSNVVAIAAGEMNCMALKADGTVVAWGAGTNNTGNNSNFGQSIVPQGLSNVVQIATGGDADLAFRADGSLVGWGDNYYGQATLPRGLSNIVAIAAGYNHSLALKADGTVIGWGDNSAGQINTPAGLSNVVAIYANDFNSAALIGNGPPLTQAPLVNPRWTGQGFSLEVSSQSGHTYRLEYTDTLTASNWTALPLVAGTGGMLTLIDPNPSSDTQRFYRVRRW